MNVETYMRYCKLILLATCFFIFLSSSDAQKTQDDLSCCRAISYTDVAGKIVRGYYALVDLEHVKVSMPDLRDPVACPDPKFPFRVVTPETLPVAAQQSRPALVINGNFFEWDRKIDDNAHNHTCMVPRGWAVGSGKVLSKPIAEDSGVFDSLILRSSPDKTGSYWTFVPHTPDNYDPNLAAVMVSGISIIQRGMIVAGTNGIRAKMKWRKRNPRIAIGGLPDGHTIVVVLIEGRLPGESEGIDLPGLAQYMQYQFGVLDAIALDGGGSATLSYASSPGSLLTNRPSDIYPTGSAQRSARPSPIFLTFDRVSHPQDTIQYGGFELRGIPLPATGTTCFKAGYVLVSGTNTFARDSKAGLSIISEQAVVLTPELDSRLQPPTPVRV